MPYGITMQKIFIVTVLIALVDSIDEVLFAGTGFLGDFSLVASIIGLLYIIGSLIVWVILLLESIVLLDFITPLIALAQIMMLFIAIIGESVVGFLFDIIAFPFSLIAHLLTMAGLSPQVTIWVGGWVLQIDLGTITFRLGVSAFLDKGTGAWATAQFTILGTEGGNNILGSYDFKEIKGFGASLWLQFKALGASLDPDLTMSLESAITNMFNQIKQDVGEPSKLFNDLLDKIRDLGRRLGLEVV